MDKNIYHYIKYLQSNSSYKIKILDKSYENYDISQLNKGDKLPILYFLVFNQIDNTIIKNINEYNGIKIYDVEDCYELDNIVNIINVYHFNYIFYKYDCEQLDAIIKHTHSDIKYIKTPHCIDPNKFKIIPNIKKDIDILLYGNLSDFYPFRQRIFTLLKQSNISYGYLPHPGYIKDTALHNDICIEQNLCELINKAKFTIVTCSKFEYLLKKYIEITMCGSIMIGNYPTKENNLYKDNYIHIHEEMSDEDIIQKIQNGLIMYNTIKDTYIDYCNKISNDNYTYKKGLELFEKAIDYIKKNINMN